MTNNEDQALNNTACGDPISSQVHPESAMPSIRAKDAAAAGEVDALAHRIAERLIQLGARTHSGIFAVVRACLATAPAPQAATVQPHDPADEKQVEAWARRIAAEEALTVGLTPFEAVKRAALTQQAAPEAPECDYRMPDGRLCPKCGNVHGSLATTASASREVCTTCGGSKVDPGGLPICRDCGRAPAPSREPAPAAGEGLAALDALAKQLARIHLSCRSNAPKLDVRDMLTAMRRMDEWKTLHALLAAPTLGGAPQDLLTIGTLAWALIATNGNIRFWSRNRSTVERMQGHAPDATLTPIIGAAHQAQAERAAVPSFWNSQRKMIERAIIGLRDGWATRKDADDALAALLAAPVAQEGERSGAQAWEYSFIHSSAIGHGDSEIGPCLTYDRAQAYGVGCIKQREVWVATPSSTEGSAQAAPDEVRELIRLRTIVEVASKFDMTSMHLITENDACRRILALRTTSTPAGEGAAS